MFRHERKYLVPYNVLKDLRDRFSGFVRPDVFSEEDMYGRCQYTVRSIYFDSPGLGNYHEKLSGVMDRCKLRVRGYNEHSNNEMVFLEVKKKKGNRILKHRTMVRYNFLEEILFFGDLSEHLVSHNGQTEDHAIDQASRFLFHYKMKNQRPVCLVCYDREAYHGKLNPGIRITFDKNIRSKINPDLSELFQEDAMSQLFKNHFILEVKYFEDMMPDWIKSIIYEFSLRSEALSKYVMGIDAGKSLV